MTRLQGSAISDSQNGGEEMDLTSLSATDARVDSKLEGAFAALGKDVKHLLIMITEDKNLADPKFELVDLSYRVSGLKKVLDETEFWDADLDRYRVNLTIALDMMSCTATRVAASPDFNLHQVTACLSDVLEATR